MTLDATWLANLALFSFAALGSPGPNNIILANHGLTFGWRRTVPVLLGVALGFGAMLLSLLSGIYHVIDIFPKFLDTVGFICSGYLLYLAWMVWLSAGVSASGEIGSDRQKPIGFVKIALFQWVNPKAWSMGTIGVSQFVIADAYVLSGAALVIMVVFCGLITGSTWSLIGIQLRRSLRLMTLFSRTSAVVLALMALIFLYDSAVGLFDLPIAQVL